MDCQDNVHVAAHVDDWFGCTEYEKIVYDKQEYKVELIADISPIGVIFI